jgi:hypothetical protein
MRRCTDPLALDPLSPIADRSSTTDPLALEPLSPRSAGARPIDAGFLAADAALGLPRDFRAVGTGLGIRRGTHPDASRPMRDRSWRHER